MKIYLASPYSHPHESVREERFWRAAKYAGVIMRTGVLVFSPIAHTHPIAVRCDLPKGFDFWEKYDRTFIEWCDELWILGIEGYSKSIGIEKEKEIAEELGKPVKIYIPALGEAWSLDKWNHGEEKNNGG